MRIIRYIVLFTFVCAATVRAQTLADRVPKEAIAYLGWKGADSPDIGYAGSHLQAVVDASGFAQVRDQVIPQLMQKITEQSNDHGEGALAVKTTLGILWRHPTAIFFAGTTKDANGAMAPRAGLICRAGTEGDALLTLFNAAVHAPGASPPLRAFTAGDCTVCLIGYDSDGAIPADAATSLRNDEAFERMIQQTGKDSAICGYVDVAGGFAQIDAAVAAGQDEDKATWPKARDASGLTGIKHIAYGAGFDGKDWQSQCFVDAPAPRAGLLTVMEPSAIDAALLARIPATATTAMLGQFNLGALLTQVRAIIVAANPGAGDMFDKGMGIAQMMIGRSLQRDILDPLGSQWALYSDASIPSSIITTTQPAIAGDNTVVVNKLIDPAKASQGWTMLSYAISNASAGYIRHNHLPVSTSMGKNGDQLVFTVVTPLFQPSWTMKDGFMYFGVSPDGVVAAANAASGALITQQPAFADLAKALCPTGAMSGFQFSNLPVSAPVVYPKIEAALKQLRILAQRQSVTLPDQILPPLDKLLPELTPALNVSWADADGWHARSREPFPGSSPQASMGTVGTAALLTSILLPSLNRATANRVKCASNERQIGQSMLLFANDHQGKYPANFGELLAAGTLTPEVFLCPSSNTALPPNYKAMAPAGMGDWITDHGDYVYVAAGLTTSCAATEILAYEKPEDHKAGMNILFGDGHVEFDLMADAVKQIVDQHKTVPTVHLPGAPDQAPVTRAP
jgi:prepilin-type processing-associated H-X9-DG protein